MQTMMSTLFNVPAPAIPAELLAGIPDVNDVIAGGGGIRRISIKGGVFREVIGGKEVNVSDARAMEIVLVNAAPIYRVFHGTKYVEGAKDVMPSCWSADGITPSPLAVSPQASRCNEQCPQNIAGSGDNGTRACRYRQKLAVAIPGDLGAVYALDLPPTSIFGTADGNKMPLQAYGRYLKSHNTHGISIVTEMRFDVTNSSSPKLVFRPIRPLNAEELNQVIALRSSPEAEEAIAVMYKPKEAPPAPPAAPAPSQRAFAQAKASVVPPAPVAPEPPVEAPTVRKAKAPVEAPVNPTPLAGLMNKWDDE